MEKLGINDVEKKESFINCALQDKIITDKLDEILSRIEIKNNRVKINDIDDLFLDDETESLLIYYLDLKNIEIQYDVLEKKDLDELSFDDNLKLFLQDISKYGLLTFEEEKRLTLKYYYEKDEKAKQILIKHNLRLVVRLVKKYVTSSYDYSDLIQDGTIGLMIAIEKFDPNKGYKLSTYATWWIRQSAKRGFENNSRIVRLSVRTHQRLSHMKEIISNYLNDFGSVPTDKYLMEKLNIKDYKEIKLLKQYLTDVGSIDTLLISDDGENDECIGNFIPSDEKPVTIQVEEFLLKDAMNDALLSLSERERDIIKKRKGLTSNGKIFTLESIGKDYGLTRERIRQIEISAMRRLSENKNLKQYL